MELWRVKLYVIYAIVWWWLRGFTGGVLSGFSVAA
jgi:hypothetical protein